MSVPGLDELRVAGVLSHLDVHFARTMTRLAGDASPVMALAAALASRQVRLGHVCLALEAVDGTDIADEMEIDTEENSAPTWTWPTLSAWTEALGASPLVGGDDAPTPLVLDRGNRLYLRRYWLHEDRLASSIKRRLGTVEGVDGDRLDQGLERLFAGTTETEVDVDQRAAASAAVRRRFTVITGGPGTGKTSTVVRILALLIEEALGRGAVAPRLTLLAPTGKAAARLRESIASAKERLDASAEVKSAIVEEASTIHRALGARRGTRVGFRHDANNPLRTDVVVVDEASMVDLALMARLVDAIPTTARLILLGDKDQLSSVEAGAILGDICDSGAGTPQVPETVAREVQIETGQLKLFPKRSRRPPIADAIVELRRSFRYREASGIGELAAAVNRGDAGGALEILNDPAYPEVTLIATTGDARDTGVSDISRDGYDRFVRADTPLAALTAFDRYRVLCAHHQGPGGVESVNEMIERVLANDGTLVTASRHYHRRPILVTRNDYAQRLFNGDIGICFDDPAQGRLRPVWFPAGDETPTAVAAARLPPHETVFAMSIHKSQGSEFSEVAIVLPDKPSPVLSRELLYTAITRAKERVTIFASEQIVAHTIERRIERVSGLRDALWS